MRSNVIIPTMLIIALMATGALGVQAVFAQEDPMYHTLVTKIADEFGLDEDQVEQVIHELREERQAEMHARWIELLDQAVRNGKVTDEQRQALIDKHGEVFQEMESVRLLPFKERREETLRIREEFRQWADENGIDLPAVGLGFHHEPGMHRGNSYMDGLRAGAAF